MKNKKWFVMFVLLGFLVLPGVVYSSHVKYVAWKNSDRYHRLECKVAKNIPTDERLEFNTPEEAIAQGLRACRKCYPPTHTTTRR